MGKNFIPQVLELLGITTNEKFKLSNHKNKIFSIDNTGSVFEHVNEYTIPAKVSLEGILTGVHGKVTKWRWRPRYGNKYYTFFYRWGSNTWVVASSRWGATVSEKALLKLGWIYHTQKEAEAALPVVAKEMKVKYDI